jgi:hypothetical protein
MMKKCCPEGCGEGVKENDGGDIYFHCLICGQEWDNDGRYYPKAGYQ